MKRIDELIERFPNLREVSDKIEKTYAILEELYYNENRKILLVGNGGSAADCDHIVGELMKGFKRKRPISETDCKKLETVDHELGLQLSKKLQGALPCISLANHSALNTAFINDVDGKMFFAQQVYAYGNMGDALICLSTSGNSENILYAAVTAKAKGVKVISITGKTGGKLCKLSDVCINIPEEETYKIQEMTVPIYHCLCLMLEDCFFKF